MQPAQHPVDAPDLFIVRSEQGDPSVINRDLNRLVGQDQILVIVLLLIGFPASASFCKKCNSCLPI